MKLKSDDQVMQEVKQRKLIEHDFFEKQRKAVEIS